MLLQEDKYDAVCRALKDDAIVWQKRGPPNKRSVHLVAQSMCTSYSWNNITKTRLVYFHCLADLVI